MNYPIWDVPGIGGGWVIGAIAIFHVLISHFAVGGGLYLPMAEAKAKREGRADWLEVLRGHSRFFLILTGVYGAASGVGIWFAIGLASPEGTSTLIHNFVFAWAIEWIFFILELAAAAVYYYTWDRIPERLHLTVGFFYAAVSFMTLFVINGILTFMLTPGAEWLAAAGTGREASAFWPALFNPTYLPSLLLRTLVCVALAGVWAMVTASRIDGLSRPRLKAEVLRWSVRWLIPAFLLMPIAFIWYLSAVPSSQGELLRLGISSIGQGTFTQVTRAALVTVMTSGTLLGVVYFIAWKNPLDFSFGHALAVLALALAATAATEHAREMLRKPYLVAGHMYSNGIRLGDVARLNREGFLAAGRWSGEPGALMCRGQCFACHTLDGYRSLRKLLHGRDRASVRSFLEILHRNEPENPYRAYRPPLAGPEAEGEALPGYLPARLPAAGE